MKTKTQIVLFMTFVSLGCNNRMESNSSKPSITESWATPTMSDTPANLDSDFRKFLTYFSNDSLFQVSRIDFPLEVTGTDDNFKDLKITINKGDFQKVNFGDTTAATREFDKYEETIRVNGNKAIIEIRGIDNGINIDIFFEKKNGQWKLLTWIDSST